MPTDSFSWWLINFAVTVGFMAIAVATGEWLFAFGGLISAGLMMVTGLAGTSTEEGSAEELPSLVYPPGSATNAPYQTEEELGGESKD